jgi:hypothetical protein
MLTSSNFKSNKNKQALVIFSLASLFLFGFVLKTEAKLITVGTTTDTIYMGGNLGVGTTNPGARLEIQPAINGYPQIRFRTPGYNYWDITSMNNLSDSDLTFGMGGSEKARFNNAGNFGIGTTNPASKLHITGNVNDLVTIDRGASATSTLRFLGANGGEVARISHKWNPQAGVGNALDFNLTASNVTVLRLGFDQSDTIPFATFPVGNLGIGLTNPSTKLDVSGTFRNSLATTHSLLAGSGNVVVMADNTGALYSTTAASLLSGASNFWGGTKNGNIWNGDAGAGNVGIGTTNPSSKLYIQDGGTWNASSWVASFHGNAYDQGTYSGIKIMNGGSTEYNKWVGITAESDSGASNSTGMGLYVDEGAIPALKISSNGNVGIGTTAPGVKLDVANGIIRQSGYSVSDAATDNILVNGDFELGNYGWSSGTVVTGGLSGNNALQITGNVQITSNDYIPVDPTKDIFQLDAWVKKSVAGTTPGILYFGYIAFDANKNAITTAPCGTYCYFAASGATIPVDGAWHKYSATTVGEGTVYPNFPVGTKYVVVLGLINYAGSGDAVTLIDHVTLKRLSKGPTIIGNNFSSTNLVDRNEYSKLYTTAASNLVVEPAGTGNVGIGVTAPGTKLDISGSFRNSLATTHSLLGAAGNVVVMADNTGTLYGTPQATFASANSLWGGTKNGNIWNGDAGVGNVGIGTTNPTYNLQIGTDGGLANSIRIGSYQVANNTRQYIGYARADSGLFESAGDGDTPNTVKAGVAGIRIVNTPGEVSPAQADNSVQILTHTYNGGSQVALHVDHRGGVGIGTTAPGAKLEVNGDLFMTAGGVNSITMNRAALFLAGNDDCNAAVYSNISGSNCYNAGHGNDTLAFNGYNGLAFTTRASGDNVRMYIQDSNGNIGVGTTAPSSKIHVKENSQTEYYGTDNSQPSSNLLLEGVDTTRVIGKGPSLTFAFPANTDGTNVWSQARILASPDNNSNGSAIGRLYLQVRDNYNPGTGGSWNWRTGIMIAGSGNVGIANTSPGTKLDIAGTLRNSLATTHSLLGGSGNVVVMADNTGALYTSSAASSILWSGSTGGNIWSANSGNVGIGLTNPEGKLHILGMSPAAPATTGTSPTGLIARLETNGTNEVLDIGSLGGGQGTWLQGTNRIALGGVYPILLNPNGGNVGIGTTAPGTKLDVRGKTQLDNSNTYGTYTWAGGTLQTNSIEILDRVNGSTSDGVYPTLTFHDYGNGGAQFSMEGATATLHLGSGQSNSAGVLGVAGGYFSKLKIWGGLTVTGLTSGVVTADSSGNLSTKADYQSKIQLTPFSYDTSAHYYWNKIAHLDGAYAHLNVLVTAQENADGNGGQTTNEINVTLNGALNTVRITNIPTASNRGPKISCVVDSNRDVWVYTVVSWAPQFYFYVRDSISTTVYNPVTVVQETQPSTAVVADNETKLITFSTGAVVGSDVLGLANLNNSSYGLGTTNPGTRLDVSGTFRNSLATTHSLLAGSGNVVVLADNAGALYSTPLATFTSTNSLWGGTKNSNIWNGDAGVGNVGIGTTAPSANLDVNGSVRFNKGAGVVKRYITTITRSLGATAGDYTYLGNINGTGLGTYATIYESHHDCGTINSATYEMNDVYYSGATTDWMQIPTHSYQSYNGGQDVAIDVRRSATGGDFELRIRNVGGPCGTVNANIEIQTNGGFTPSTTTGTGGTVAGYLASNVYQFPVANNRFTASTNGLFILNSGLIGIGKTNPSKNLDVVGDINASLTVNATGLCIGGVCKTDWNSLVPISGNVTLTGPLTIPGLSLTGDLDLNWHNIRNVTKLSVGTIDPLYNIHGVNYATFASSVAGGVKEEYIGKAKINTKNIDDEYEFVVDFDKEKEGSDLWVWRHAVDFSDDNVQVLITPSGKKADIYYVIDGNRLTLKSDKAVSASYHLIGNRIDWKKWPTRAIDQNEKASFIIK